MPLRPALLATLAAAAAAEFPPGSLPACLNSSRRIFLDSAQLRIYEKPGPGGPKKVFAFEVLGGDECKARVRVNTKYAVTRGIQGTAHPDATIDMCAAKAHLDALRAKSHLFWDGTAPDEKAWHEAFLKHDGRARGGELHRMVVAHQRGASKAAQLGFAAARDAWRRYPRCAVVGGAPSLGKASNGAEIDAHDAVLRFNDHPSGGAYSRTAGNVTTFRFLNSLYAGQPSPEPAARVLQVGARARACHKGWVPPPPPPPPPVAASSRTAARAPPAPVRSPTPQACRASAHAHAHTRTRTRTHTHAHTRTQTRARTPTRACRRRLSLPRSPALRCARPRSGSTRR